MPSSAAARRTVSPLALGLAAACALLLGGAALAQSSVARDKLERLNLRETALNAEQGRNMNRLARLLSVLQQFRRDPPPALLVSPRDATDAVRAAILVKAMAPELERRARAYAVEGAEITRQRRLAAVASEALFTAESEAAEQRPGAAAQPELRGADPLLTPPVAAPERLTSPTPGEIVAKFGSPVAGGGRANGLTIAAGLGARVQSPGDGIVQFVGPVKGWGVILILRLTGGYHLVLAGLDRTSVDPGQSVAAGSPVGWMPDGRQSRSELYLEVRERGAPVDPERWMTVSPGPAPGKPTG